MTTTTTDAPTNTAGRGVMPVANINLSGLSAQDPAAREVIRHAAYAIWESEGRPENRALDNWLEAESTLLPQQ